MLQVQDQQEEALGWQRKILSGYWIVILVSLIAEFVAFIIKLNIASSTLGHFAIHTVAIPTGVQLLIILINELLYRKRPKSRPYLMIITGIIMGAVLIYGNKTVIGIQYVMLLPMIVSVFQFKMKYLTFAFCMIMPTLALIYLYVPKVWDSMTIYEKFALFFILSGGYFMLAQLLNRGNHLINQLTKSTQSERDLIIRNTIMEKLSKVDTLTNLYNHRTFQEYFDNMVEYSEQNQMELQLAIIDIDNFKSINDTYGHATGDLILKRVAEVLMDSFTENDIIARYGGEEFAILFPSKTTEHAVQLCENARKSIYQLNHEELDGRKVSVSIGISSYVSGLGKTNFFNHTDELMYKAKKTGKNKTEYSKLSK